MIESLEETVVECSSNIRASEQHRNSDMLTILDLPSEVLDHIFSFLSVRERIRTEWVCRSWREFGKNYKWSWPKKLEPNMLVDFIGLDNDYIWSSILSRCGSSLKDIVICVDSICGNHKRGPTLGTCHVIGAMCPNLVNILFIIANAVENSEAFLSVTRGCTKLKKVSLHMMEYATADSGDSGNMSLALKECQSLEYLELTTCKTAIVVGCLDAIMVPLKGLKLQANSWTYRALVAKKLLSRKDPLEKFEMFKLEDNTTDWPMEVFHGYENTLRELNLSDCHMSCSKWSKILAPLKHLEVLSLNASRLIEDEVMRVVANSCKKLRKLNISYTAVTDVGVSYLTALPNLTVLYLDASETISGEGILSLAACGHLEELYIANICRNGDLIEESCIALATNCPNLRVLDVHNNMNITNKLVDELRLSIQRGLLKGPVAMRINRSLVNHEVEVCENLKFVF